MGTPKEKVNYTPVAENFGMIRLLKTPKVKDSGVVKDEFGTKRLLQTPKQKVKYEEVSQKFGTKRLLQTPKQKVKYEEVNQKFGTKRLFLSPKNKILSEEVDDHFGVKRLFQGDMKREKYEEVKEKFGTKRLFQSPKERIKQDEVREKFGTKRLFLSPKEKVITKEVDKYFGTKRIFYSPKKKYRVCVDDNLGGVKRLMNLYDQHDFHDAVENFDSKLFCSPQPPSKKARTTKNVAVKMTRMTRSRLQQKEIEVAEDDKVKDFVTLKDSTTNEDKSKKNPQICIETIPKRTRGRKARNTLETPKLTKKITRSRNAVNKQTMVENTDSFVVENHSMETDDHFDSTTKKVQIEKSEKSQKKTGKNNSKLTRSRGNLKSELVTEGEFSIKNEKIPVKKQNKITNNGTQKFEITEVIPKQNVAESRITRKRKAAVDNSTATAEESNSQVLAEDGKFFKTSSKEETTELVESKKLASVKRTTRKRKAEIETVVGIENVNEKKMITTRSRRGKKVLEDTNNGKEVCEVLDLSTKKKTRGKKVAFNINEKAELKKVVSVDVKVSKNEKKVQGVSKSVDRSKAKQRSKTIVTDVVKKSATENVTTPSMIRRSTRRKTKAL